MSRTKTPLKCAVAGLAVAMVAEPALADPPVENPPGVVLPRLFCLRISDMEKVVGDPGSDAFVFEIQMMNWTDAPAGGLLMGMSFSTNNQGAAPFISGVGIDPDGRGGDISTSGQIGPGVFDPVTHHGGAPNDWTVTAVAPDGSAAGFALGAGTPIPERDLIGAATTGGPGGTQAAVDALVPGTPFDPGTLTHDQSLDALGDTAIDGGPTPYVPGDPFDGPLADGGNARDGFIIEFDDWDVGEIVSLNWFLLDTSLGALGTSFAGNSFGFGALTLQRQPLGGAVVGPAVFAGNTGMGTSPELWFDGVWRDLDPVQMVGEIGAGITGEFRNYAGVQFAANQIGAFGFEAAANTDVVIPLPAGWLALLGGLGILGARARRRPSVAA